MDAGGYLCPGRLFRGSHLRRCCKNCKLHFQYLLTGDELVETRGGHKITDHKIVAWMQGRMEFGPRALGNREHSGVAARSPTPPRT